MIIISFIIDEIHRLIVPFISQAIQDRGVDATALGNQGWYNTDGIPRKPVGLSSNRQNTAYTVRKPEKSEHDRSQ